MQQAVPPCGSGPLHERQAGEALGGDEDGWVVRNDEVGIDFRGLLQHRCRQVDCDQRPPHLQRTERLMLERGGDQTRLV